MSILRSWVFGLRFVFSALIALPLSCCWLVAEGEQHYWLDTFTSKECSIHMSSRLGAEVVRLQAKRASPLSAAKLFRDESGFYAGTFLLDLKQLHCPVAPTVMAGLFPFYEESPRLWIHFQESEAGVESTVTWAGKSVKQAGVLKIESYGEADGDLLKEAVRFELSLGAESLDWGAAKKILESKYLSSTLQFELGGSFVPHPHLPQSKEFLQTFARQGVWYHRWGRPPFSVPYYFALLSKVDSEAREALLNTGGDLEALVKNFRKIAKEQKKKKKEKTLDLHPQGFTWPAYAAYTRGTAKVAVEAGAHEINSLHLLIALWEAADPEWQATLEAMGFSLAKLQATLNMTPDLTAEVEVLGNPALEQYPQNAYPRNLWDMRYFEGKIYLGTGNSSNLGPARNAGPVPVIAYDLGENVFNTEYTVADEQIDRFRIIDGKLTIPGHDPREGWKLGNFYQLREEGWMKQRNIPGGIHTYDLIQFGETLFAGLGSIKGAEVYVSADYGETWTVVESDMELNDQIRVMSLFPCADQVYVSTYSGECYVYENKRLERLSVNLFPDSYPVERLHYVKRNVPFQKELVYIGANATNDHQSQPFGLFHAPAIDRARKVELMPGEAPWDLLSETDRCYVLTAALKDPLEPNSPWVIRVRASEDLKKWPILFQFESPTFARSFEKRGDSFYFGLGSATNDLSEATGELWRVQFSE